MIPGDIMLFLIWIPAMLTALGVVREKELGSITNFYATPTTRLEFLWGKQAPYVVLAMVEFAYLDGSCDLALCGAAKRQWTRSSGWSGTVCDREHQLRTADLGFRSDPDGGYFCRGDHH